MGIFTRVGTKLTELEANKDNPDSLRVAQSRLDGEFRIHHLAIVDLTDDDEVLAEEQQALDYHDE